MKRVLFLSFFVLALIANSFASQGIVIEKMNDVKTFDRVIRFLDASYDQKKDLKYIFTRADKEYKKAIEKGMSLEEAAEKAVNFSLANSKIILSKDQYSKLLQVINTTVSNYEISNKMLANK